MINERIAVPSDRQGGLEGTRSGHFGHCDVFTIIDVNNGAIESVSILNNKEHVDGGCMVPVMFLAENKVTALIAAGMGMRPLAGFNEVGIEVYFDNQHAIVKEAVEEFLKGDMKKMSEQMACGGH